MESPYDTTYSSLNKQLENNNLINLKNILINNTDNVDNMQLNWLIYRAMHINFPIAEWLINFAVRSEKYEFNQNECTMRRMLDEGSDQILDIAMQQLKDKEMLKYIKRQVKKWSRYLVLRQYDFIPSTIYSDLIYLDAPSLNDAREAARLLGHHPFACDMIFAIGHNQKELVQDLVKENPQLAVYGRKLFLDLARTRANTEIVEIFGLIHSPIRTSERVLEPVCECKC